MSHVSPFKAPFKLVTRQSVKHGGYVKIRDEVLDSFPYLTQSDIDHILPIKSKLFEDQLSNGITVYGFTDDEPLFFRYQLTIPAGGKGKGKKKDQSAGGGQLIPTVFTVWKLPHILPPVYTNSKVFPKITGVRSTSLFLPGLICPDLPDIFYLKGSTTPSSYLELFPNVPIDTKALESSTTTTTTDAYPKYFNKHSFNYMLVPGELRAMYVLGNPYCIGICVVPEKVKTLDVLSYARKSGSSARYASPWGNSEWITQPEMIESYPEKQSIGIFKWPIQTNPAPEIVEQDGNSTDTPTSTITTSSSSSSSQDGQSTTTTDATTTTTTDTTTSTTKTISLQKGQRVVDPPDGTTSPTSHVPLLSIITTLARYISVSRDSTSTAMLLLLRAIVADPFFQPILSIKVPTIGSSAGHPQAPSLDLLATTTTIFDTRPMGAGVGLSVLHSLNDTLSAIAPHRYPQDAFSFTSADQCIPKIHQECAFQWRRVFLLLRIAYLSCVCLPVITLGVPPSTVIPKTFQFSLGALAGMIPGAGSAKPQSQLRQQQQQQQQQHTFRLHVDPTVIESDFIVVGEGHSDDDDDDEDGEDGDEDDDEDGYETGDDDDFDPLIDGGIPPDHTAVDDESQSPEPTICENCYQARLDWALQYVVNSPDTELPAQYSVINSQIRMCSTCPNALKYIASPQYKNELIGPPCKNATTGGCGDVIVELRVNDSPYQKVGALVKKGEKRGWLKTKTISGQPVVYAVGSLSAKITETDRRAVEEYTQQYKRDIKAAHSGGDGSTIGGDKNTALVSMLHLSQYPPNLGTFLNKHCPQYTVLISMLEQKLKTASMGQHQLQLSDILGMYQKKCLSSNVGDEQRIASAILSYIKDNKLEIVIKDGQLVKCSVGEKYLPPVAQALLNARTVTKRGNGVDSDSSSDDDDDTNNNYTPSGAWGNKQSVNAMKKGMTQQKQQQQQQQQKQQQRGELSDSDDDMPSFHRYDGDDDDDGNILDEWDNRTDGNKKQLPKVFGGHSRNKHLNQAQAQAQPQQKQQQQQESQKKQKKGKQQPQQQQQQQQNQKSKQHAGHSFPSSGTSVYLAYDPDLFKALNIQNNKSYLMSDLSTIIAKQFKSVHVSSTEYIRNLSILSQSNDYQQLCIQSTKGASETVLKQGLKRLPQEVQQAEASLTKYFSNSIGNIQEAVMLISTLSFKPSSAPKVIVAAVAFRGNPITLICGLERYGVDPYRLANDSVMKQYLACSVSALDVEEYKQIRMLIPQKLDVHAKTMIQVQGDQIHRVCSFLEEKIGITQENITTIAKKGGKKKK